VSGCAQAQRSEGTPQSSVSSAALVKNNRLPLPSKEPINAQASDHFYDMDYERSIQEFTLLYERHADDPDSINHLLNAVLFHELYRIGAFIGVAIILIVASFVYQRFLVPKAENPV